MHKVTFVAAVLAIIATFGFVGKLPLRFSDMMVNTILVVGSQRDLENMWLEADFTPFWLNLILLQRLLHLIFTLFGSFSESIMPWLRFGELVFVLWAATATNHAFENVFQLLLGGW